MRILNMPFAILLLVLSARAAKAESYTCGQNFERGPDQAEIGYIDADGGPTKLYLNAKAVAANKFNSRSIDNDHVLVAADLGDQGTLELNFSAAQENVMETLTSNAGVRKSLGTKKCIHTTLDDANDVGEGAQ